MKSILIKTSGDTSDSEIFLEFVFQKAKEGKVVIIPGAGSKISKALMKAGFEISFDEHGRVVKGKDELAIMAKVLKGERRKFRKKFGNLNVEIAIPLLYAGTIACPINGDNLVQAYCKGFDEIYIFTLKKRIKKKAKAFKKYPKVKIIGV